MTFQRFFHINLEFVVICALLIASSSCSHYKNHQVRMMVKHEYGKVLDFSWAGYQILEDTLLPCFEINKPITIVSHIDDKLCPECFANYLRAAEKYVNQFHTDSIQYVCIAYPRPVDRLQYALSLAEIDSSKVMVVYDLENKYLTRNSIAKLSSGYNAFLIDEKQKIILLGDPIRSQSMYDLCKKQIEELLEDYRNR